AKAFRLPDLEFVAKADKGDLVLDAGVALQRLGEDRPPLAVDLQHLARAIECRRKLFAFLRVGRETPDQRLDFLQQRVAAGIERRPVQRRVAIETLESVAREYRAERCRNR